MRETVAKHLTDSEYQMLLSTHKNHFNSMGKADQLKRSVNHITKVVKHAKENCFNVYYGNADWFHYTARGDWY